ncbi:hypothetical protein [Polyangium sp. y55x31]|uniref:hypothetical protein n=1 Tax=Polyangium sp. y55x31 TaxID=3042688 RepID=UPI002482B2B4|nr:hypothetical protein [Polyangium sp. y55x31]MDI1483969.1 hypothetical protein [Polyangium sp. y55x31]
MNNEAGTKTRSPLRTLRLGTVTAGSAETAQPMSERYGPRSAMRPMAPDYFSIPPEPSGVVQALSAEPRSGPGSRKLRTPLDEVNELVRKMEIRELGDVLLYAQRLLAARGKAPDPDVISAILAAMGRLYGAYRNAPGVPLPILRGALPDVPRKTLDDALLEAEARRMLRLVVVSPLTPFVERAAGLHDPRRGLLYFVSAPDGTPREPEPMRKR